MAARRQARVRPVDTAIVRLMALAAKGVQPTRMAREVEVIVAEWLREPEADPSEAKAWLDELREQIAVGVGDAEEQLSDIDTSEPAAVKQAQATLAALVATRDAAERARSAVRA
jgi:polyhydroxyalkanoate synthesis regulator phasin